MIHKTLYRIIQIEHELHKNLGMNLRGLERDIVNFTSANRSVAHVKNQVISHIR
jgi:hypothetical protein